MKTSIILQNSNNEYVCKEKPIEFSEYEIDALKMSYAKALKIKTSNPQLGLHMSEVEK